MAAHRPNNPLHETESMAPHESGKRKLDAVVGLQGRILTWKCSACSWTKLPDTPHDRIPTQNTVDMFRKHQCADHTPAIPKRIP